jgi:hypothetical protein
MGAAFCGPPHPGGFISDGFSNLNEAIMSAAIRHSSGGWNPGDEPNNPDTGFRRYDVKLFLEIGSLILGQTLRRFLTLLVICSAEAGLAR